MKWVHSTGWCELPAAHDAPDGLAVWLVEWGSPTEDYLARQLMAECRGPGAAHVGIFGVAVLAHELVVCGKDAATWKVWAAPRAVAAPCVVLRAGPRPTASVALALGEAEIRLTLFGSPRPISMGPLP